MPKDPTKYAVIFEFKNVVTPKASPENLAVLLDQAAQAALAQIEQKQYLTEIKQRGFTKILRIGLAFNNKNFSLVSQGGISDY